MHKIKRIIQDPISLSLQKNKEKKSMLKPVAEQIETTKKNSKQPSRENSEEG